jgi:hypothetical protein
MSRLPLTLLVLTLGCEPPHSNKLAIDNDGDGFSEFDGDCDIPSCGYFANNTQLSTLRATNVKEELLLGADKARYKGRITVSGWGPEKLENEQEPTAAVSRRVEIRFVWEADDAGTASRGLLHDIQ